ncbi:MAG: hypothetical protein KTR25_07275 [Myxococcales bacterium]|nr:hypothetical protein [Myxococcales bacterium]
MRAGLDQQAVKWSEKFANLKRFFKVYILYGHVFWFGQSGLHGFIRLISYLH